MIPDITSGFSRLMGTLFQKHEKGFRQRSRRYSIVVNDREIGIVFEEPGKCNDLTSGPYGESSPESMVAYPWW